MNFDKRLLFCLSPGRCGTQYLAEILATVPGVHAEHEGEPDFADCARQARRDWKAGAEFWLEKKLPYIADLECEVYAETGHLFGKGFVEPLLELGIVPDAVVLSRAHREVALSLWRRGDIPGRSTTADRYYLHPAAPSLLQLPHWSRFNNYQLCYWYCLEMKQRIEAYATKIASRGGQVFRLDFPELVAGDGFERLVKSLGLPEPGPEYHEKRGTVYNANPAHIADELPPFDLDEAEAEVGQAIRTAKEAPPSKEKPSLDLVILHQGTIRVELATLLMGLLTAEKRYKVAVSFASAQPIANNRNQIVKEFIVNERHADWLGMIDCDIVPMGDWLKYLESDYDVVGFPAPVWKPVVSPDAPVVWNVQTEWEEQKFAESIPDPRETPVFEAAAVGTGAILIRRGVLEHPDMKAPFMDVYDEHGIREVGEDLNFCHRAGKAGFKVWVSGANPCSHFKEVDLRLIARLLWENAT
jgi:hypothetical protein